MANQSQPGQLTSNGPIGLETGSAGIPAGSC